VGPFANGPAVFAVIYRKLSAAEDFFAAEILDSRSPGKKRNSGVSN
jgi:hypothetical protein